VPVAGIVASVSDAVARSAKPTCAEPPLGGIVSRTASHRVAAEIGFQVTATLSACSFTPSTSPGTVSIGSKGPQSRASPIPSLSESICDGFGIVGQLPQTSGYPSPSPSGPITCRCPHPPIAVGEQKSVVHA